MPKDLLELALMKAMVSTSFIKPMKTGHGKGQTKYTIMGQRVEGPALEAVWELILKNELFGGTSNTNVNF